MAHGFPDWSPIATGASSELPTYRSGSTQTFAASDPSRFIVSTFNPANSGALVKVRCVRMGFRAGVADEGVCSTIVALYRATSQGTGTNSNPPVPHNPAGPPSPLTTKVDLTVDPALSEQFLQFPIRFQLRQSLQPSRQSFPTLYFELYQQAAAGQQQPIYLPPGYGYTIFVSAPGHACDVTHETEWTEEPYTP